MQLTQRFELRKDTTNRNGEHPVALIIRVASQRRKLASGVTVLPELWDKEAQRIRLINGNLKKELSKKYPELDLPANFDLKRANISLDDLSKNINDICARFELDEISYSADMLLENYKLSSSPKTKKDESHNLVFDFIDKYIDDNQLTREKGSMGVYRALKRHLEAYQKHTRTKVKFSEINYAFFNHSKIIL